MTIKTKTKPFYAYFMHRTEEGNLEDKYVDITATSKKSAVQQAKMIAKNNCWRFVGTYPGVSP